MGITLTCLWIPDDADGQEMTKPGRKQIKISRRVLMGGSVGSMLSASSNFLVAQPPDPAKTFGGLPMGLHGATLQKFPVAEVIRILVEDLQLHYLELTPSQIRLRAVAQGTNQGPAASISEVRNLRSLLQSTGITPSAWGPIALGSNDADLRQLFGLASELGVRNLTCITQAEHLDSLEKLADESQLCVAIHNNAPGSSFSKISEVVTALANRGPNIGACLDVGNAIRASEDPVLALQQLEAKIFGIHLKSVSSRDPDSDVVELGTGLLDTDTFLQALKEVKLVDDVALSLEYLAQLDQPVPGALRSLDLLRAALSA
jgi:inosose dehydratase